MNDKDRIISMLKNQFSSWEDLLDGLSEEQVTAPTLPSDMSIKDEIAHLWAWQQRSIARAEAALHDKEPNYPDWPKALAPDPEEDVDKTNAWIYETNRDRPWRAVYADWRSQFQRLVELSEQIPETDLLQEGRYAWMGTYPLYASLEGTYEHHAEHLEKLLAQIQRR